MEKVMLFGASELGKIAYELLKDNYEIICFVDNDENKWGKMLLDLTIIAPSEMNNNRNYTVIIASYYYKEISIQLFNLQITDMKIFKYDFENKRYYIEEMILNSSKFKEKSKTEILDTYTIFDNKVNISSTKTLLVCRFFSVYTKEYIEKLYEKYQITFDILTLDKLYLDNINLKYIGKIYKYNNIIQLVEILRSIEKYKFIHIHYLDPIYGELSKEISDKCNKLILTIWGSDFYRTSEYEKTLQEPIIKIADVITFDNEIVMSEFKTYFNCYDLNTHICRFGLTVLEYINNTNLNRSNLKTNFNIPEDSIVITCGYNANPCHNHKKIIDSLNELDEDTKTKLFLIFPMTYGREDLKYVDNIKNNLLHLGIKHIVLEKFMDYEEVNRIISITDIFIQVQTTDTLSATMQEHLFNGNIVITGSWLPYSLLKKKNILFFEVREVNEISRLILQLVNRIDEVKTKCANNRKIIWELSSWESTGDNWARLFKL